MTQPKTSDIPQHVGLILDGNRRWAKAKGLPTLEGHRQGAEVFKTIALAAFRRDIKFVSAYVFSNENWSRTKEEVGYLMGLVVKATEKYLKDFDKAGIKILIAGRRENLPEKVLKAIERTETSTRGNSKGTLVLCFNYGGREEIVDAVNSLEGPATVEGISAALYAPEAPDIDLLIRTSGEQRTSGFMLWRAAYAELYFASKHWPDFTEEDLDVALADYASRDRRFGQ